MTCKWCNEKGHCTLMELNDYEEPTFVPDGATVERRPYPIAFCETEDCDYHEEDK